MIYKRGENIIFFFFVAIRYYIIIDIVHKQKSIIDRYTYKDFCKILTLLEDQSGDI